MSICLRQSLCQSNKYDRVSDINLGVPFRRDRTAFINTMTASGQAIRYIFIFCPVEHYRKENIFYLKIASETSRNIETKIKDATPILNAKLIPFLVLSQYEDKKSNATRFRNYRSIIRSIPRFL